MSVSLIIPCYKDALTLARALDSVFAQTHPVEEVIVVNDASPETEAIEAVLAAYPQVSYLVNPRNLGLAASRNKGVRAASGDVVCFLDADDELHPQKIELQRSLYRPGRAISCKVMRIGNERGTDRVPPYGGAIRYTEYLCASRLVRRNILTGASLMISRELFLAQGGYDEALLSCEDFDLWLRLLDAGVPVLNIDLPLYLYRVNEHGLSRNRLAISRWELEVVRAYFARHRQGGAARRGEALTLAVWLFRHFVRCAQCHDSRLMQATLENLELLRPWPFARAALRLSRALGLPRFAAYMLRHGD
jgi:glycosyltransferase involved in cell wall biosynthesis